MSPLAETLLAHHRAGQAIEQLPSSEHERDVAG
jgi:hypothetical protein